MLGPLLLSFLLLTLVSGQIALLNCSGRSGWLCNGPTAYYCISGRAVDRVDCPYGCQDNNETGSSGAFCQGPRFCVNPGQSACNTAFDTNFQPWVPASNWEGSGPNVGELCDAPFSCTSMTYCNGNCRGSSCDACDWGNQLRHFHSNASQSVCDNTILYPADQSFCFGELLYNRYPDQRDVEQIESGAVAFAKLLDAYIRAIRGLQWNDSQTLTWSCQQSIRSMACQRQVSYDSCHHSTTTTWIEPSTTAFTSVFLGPDACAQQNCECKTRCRSMAQLCEVDASQCSDFCVDLEETDGNGSTDSAGTRSPLTWF